MVDASTRRRTSALCARAATVRRSGCPPPMRSRIGPAWSGRMISASRTSICGPLAVTRPPAKQLGDHPDRLHEPLHAWARGRAAHDHCGPLGRAVTGTDAEDDPAGGEAVEGDGGVGHMMGSRTASWTTQVPSGMVDVTAAAAADATKGSPSPDGRRRGGRQGPTTRRCGPSRARRPVSRGRPARSCGSGTRICGRPAVLWTAYAAGVGSCLASAIQPPVRAGFGPEEDP